MHHVKMLADVVDVARKAADRWYVTNGSTAVGPVDLQLLARGVEAGKVPVESFVRHEAWKVWRPLAELAEITGDDGQIEHTRGSRSVIDDALATPFPSAPEQRVVADGSGVEERDTLLLMLSSSVARCHADVALIHHVADEGAVAICAHGPDMFEALGIRTKLLDPALLAAAAGTVVVTEPTPGPAGASIIARLSRLGVVVESAVMFPIRPHKRLFGTIEIGRRTPFRPAEVASLDAMIEALVFKLESLV